LAVKASDHGDKSPIDDEAIVLKTDVRAGESDHALEQMDSGREIPALCDERRYRLGHSKVDDIAAGGVPSTAEQIHARGQARSQIDREPGAEERARDDERGRQRQRAREPIGE
jgi:hypothetical protein